MTTAAIEQLYARPKWGQGLSLHRNGWLHTHLPCADWLKRQSALKITGSNGKGSVALFTTAILEAYGQRTGCFTSPHLFDITERVQIGQENISLADLSAALTAVFALVDTYEADHPEDIFGTFEILTAAALIAFEQHSCNGLVIEAGVGGRLDVTRLIPGAITGITSIDLEHQAILGPTREHILFDKADLCPPGGTLICGPLGNDLEARLSGYLTLMDRAPVFISQACQTKVRGTNEFGTLVDFNIDGLSIPDLQITALGHHQVTNAAQAILLAKRWIAQNETEVHNTKFAEACRKALTNAVPPLRLERVQTNPVILADVCHSPDAAEKSATALQQHYPDRKLVLLTGASDNKDVKGIVTALSARADHIICSRAHMMGRAAQEVADDLTTDTVHVEDDLDEAVLHATKVASDEGAVLLIAGGLFLAAEAVTLLRGQNREALRFL